MKALLIAAIVFLSSLSFGAEDYKEEVNYILSFLNEATAEEIENIEGVGETLTNRIVEARPYRELAQLKEIKGIGEEKYGRILVFALRVWEK